MAALPLVDRLDGATLFLRPSGPVDVGGYLADVHAVAAMLPEGGHVLNLCRDRYAFAVAFGACLVRGQVSLLCGEAPMPVLRAAVEQCGCTLAIVDAAETASPVPSILVCPRGGRGDGVNPRIPAERLAALVFTSGSTGAPTAHRKHWGALAGRSRAAGARFALEHRAPASIVGTVPPGHMYGFETTVLLPLHAACASWCGQAFFPGDVQAALDGLAGPRIVVTTPLQMRALLQGMDRAELRAVISATASLDPAMAAAAETRWGAPVLEIFGATECGSIASRRTVGGDAWTLYPGVELRGGEDAATVHAEHQEAVALADEVAVLADGRFRLLGRRADLVKLGGRRASLAGLNQILLGLDGVRDGIFVVPEDVERRSTARLLAVVVAPGRSGASLLAELRDRMDPIFVPRRVVHVDALPRNALGKLPKQAVLDLLAQADG